MFPVPFEEGFIFYVTVRPGGDGIGFATVDPSDIRGLDTALHYFVAELPQSSYGSLALKPFPGFLEGSPDRDRVPSGSNSIFGNCLWYHLLYMDML